MCETIRHKPCLNYVEEGWKDETTQLQVYLWLLWGYSAVICGERVIKAMAGKGKARDMIFTFLSLLFFDVVMASVLSWYK